MYEDEFSARLSYLRLQKGVSARDMSLSIGQNAGYINNIETGKALPSMSAFFYICEFLNISPKDFFDTESSCPEYLAELVNDLKKIDPEQIQHLSYIVKGLIQNHSWCVVIKANSRSVWLSLFRQICCSYFLFIFFVNDIEFLQHHFFFRLSFSVTCHFSS